MFSATLTGQIKRILVDNEKDKEKAMLKVVLEVKKQFVREDDMPFVYPVVTIWGYDAAYVRDYGGVGHFLSVFNADYESWRGEDGDEDERISFRAGKVELLPKKLADQIEIEEDDDDDDEGSSRKKGKKRRGGKSRSERRGKSRKSRDEDDYEDDDEEEEEEKPRRRSKSKSSKKSSSKKSSKRSRKEEEDEDYDDDDYYDDDDDDYFEDDED